MIFALDGYAHKRGWNTGRDRGVGRLLANDGSPMASIGHRCGYPDQNRDKNVGRHESINAGRDGLAGCGGEATGTTASHSAPLKIILGTGRPPDGRSRDEESAGCERVGSGEDSEGHGSPPEEDWTRRGGRLPGRDWSGPHREPCCRRRSGAGPAEGDRDRRVEWRESEGARPRRFVRRRWQSSAPSRGETASAGEVESASQADSPGRAS